MTKQCPFCDGPLAGKDIAECGECEVMWFGGKIMVPVRDRKLTDWYDVPEGTLVVKAERDEL
jgi:hypothetical protein